MENFRFFDTVDTVRTGRDPSEQRIAVGQIMLSILRRENVALSQSQAFDNGLILYLAGNEPYFLALLKTGRIQIPLFRVSSLKDAFLAALEQSEVKFSAWPEIPVEYSQRATLAKDIRAGSRPQYLPTSYQEKLDALEKLNATLRESSFKPTAGTSRFELKKLLEAGWAVEEPTSPLKPILGELVALNTNFRSSHFNKIESMEITPELRESAHSFLDMCYNTVVISSLDAAGALTTSSDWAWRKWEGMRVSDSLPMITTELSEAPALRKVSWEDIYRFLKDTNEVPFDEQQKIAAAAKMIARVATEKRGLDQYYIVPKLASSFASAVVWGGLGPVGGALMGDPTMVAHIAAVAGGIGALQGFLSGESYIIKVAESLAEAKLKKKLLGFFERFAVSQGEGR